MGFLESVSPPLRPRPALERPFNVRSNPTPVKVTLLRLDPFLINITGIHKTGIKGNMIADGFITPAGFRVAPGGVGGLPVAHPQGPVMSRPLKFTPRPAGRRKEEFPADILRRKVIESLYRGGIPLQRL